MNLVKKMVFPLVLISGLTQQTFGVFENFKEVMMDSIKNNNSSVVIGALAGAGVGSIICGRNDKLFSTASPMSANKKKEFVTEIKQYNNKSWQDFAKKWRPQNCMFNPEDSTLSFRTLSFRIRVTGDIILKRSFYSLTRDRTCTSKFEGEVEYADERLIKNLKATEPKETLARSWPRTFAVLGFTTGIGALIGYQFKKN